MRQKVYMIHCFSQEEFKDLLSAYNVPITRCVWVKHAETDNDDYVHLFKAFNDSGYYDVQRAERAQQKKEDNSYIPYTEEFDDETENLKYGIRKMVKKLQAQKKSK